MKRKVKFLSFLISFFVWHALLPADIDAISIGEEAPLFSLQDISGREIFLEDIKGKVIFINFWATWCTPCRKELPLLNDLQKKSKDDVIVVTVNIDKKKSKVEAFLKKFSLDIPVLLDPDGEIVSTYGARAMPMSYVLDREGRVRFLHFGFDESKDPHLWESEIRSLLKGNI